VCGGGGYRLVVLFQCSGSVNNRPTGSGSGSLLCYQRRTENCLKRVPYFIKSADLVPMLQHIFCSGHKVVQLGSGSVIHLPPESGTLSTQYSLLWALKGCTEDLYFIPLQYCTANGPHGCQAKNRTQNLPCSRQVR
jgi:hypothetical protein